ncbi:MAG: LysM peptidoglycan-binding domain-containing protein [Roseibacillus sp.]|nr:LysM peptidoglycan-binding domain-containing protein [Roseibacillus sp.]
MFPALFGLVVLISLIAVAFVLRKLRDEHMNLRAEVVSELNSTVHPEESSLTGLQAQLGALERRLKEEEDAKGAPLSDEQYHVILRALATLLHQHEAGSSEISALLEKFPEAERQKFMAELEAADTEAGHAGLWRRIDEIEVPETIPEPAPESAPEPATEPAPESAPEPAPEPATEPAPAHGSEFLPLPGEGAQDFKDYTVEPADTLSELSRIYKVSLSSLIRANDIANPDLILIGQVLKIPVSE